MTNVINYQFRGELDVDLLAKNMKDDKTPIVIVKIDGDKYFKIYILTSFRDNYKGDNLPFADRNFLNDSYMVCTNSQLVYIHYLQTPNLPTILSNIRAIIKSHEDASLPTVKVIAIETTADWRER